MTSVERVEILIAPTHNLPCRPRFHIPCHGLQYITLLCNLHGGVARDYEKTVIVRDQDLGEFTKVNSQGCVFMPDRGELDNTASTLPCDKD